MNTDKLMIKRFEELESKADAILANKIYDFTSDEDDVQYFRVETPGFKAWATSALSLLQRVFEENSIHYQHFQEAYKQIDGNVWESILLECRAILLAAREDYAGGYLFNTRGLIQAEVFDSILEQATELLRSGYKDPACVIAGVTLETSLKELCTRNGLGHNKLDRMNADLSKAGVYNLGMQKQITA
jgi:hypothetical protein